MARPVVFVLGALLAGSVAANLYQWRHRPSAAPTATTTTTTTTSPETDEAGARDQLSANGAAQRCAADGTRGYLSLQLWLDGEAGKITYEVGGTLASSAGGQCVLQALDQVIAVATVPPRARGAVLYHTIQLPPG